MLRITEKFKNRQYSSETWERWLTFFEPGETQSLTTSIESEGAFGAEYGSSYGCTKHPQNECGLPFTLHKR
jgi:hypothetical protein